MTYQGSFDALTKVSGTPTVTGTYAVDETTGVYTFSAGDAGVEMVIDFTQQVENVSFASATWIPMMLALGEGPIDSIGAYWEGTTRIGSYLAASLAYQFFPGASDSTNQPIWGAWAAYDSGGTHYPDGEAVIPYRHTAYLASWTVNCGSDGEPPQQSFECVRQLVTNPGGTAYGTAYANANGDYSLAAIIPDFLTHPIYGMGLSAGAIL